MRDWIEAPQQFCPTFKETGKSHGWLRLPNGRTYCWSVRAASGSIRNALADGEELEHAPEEATLYLRHPMQRLMSAHCLFKIPSNGPSWKAFVNRVLQDLNPYWMPQTRLHADVDALKIVRLEGSQYIDRRVLPRLNGSELTHWRPSFRHDELLDYFKEDLEAWETSEPMTKP